MLIIAVVFAAGLLVYSLLSRVSDTDQVAKNSAAFDTALAAEQSTVMRALLKLARPLSGIRVTNPDEESPTYRAIRLKLVAGGGTFASSVEVFLATQVACTVIGAMALAATLLSHPGGVVTLVGVVGAVAVTAWPWSRVHEAASKRTNEVNAALPEFAELLLMPLNSGFGILAALDFTASRLDGPVAHEVRILTDAIRTRSRTEAEAFADAADNLGTMSARSFFTVLAQAYLEGVRVVDTITGQAQALRKTEYERLREKIKKVPNKIAIVIGIHLIPSLFVLCLYPAFTALAGM